MTTQDLLDRAEKIRVLGQKLYAMEKLAKAVSPGSTSVEKAASELACYATIGSADELKKLLSYILTTGFEAHAAKLKEEMQIVARSMASDGAEDKVPMTEEEYREKARLAYISNGCVGIVPPILLDEYESIEDIKLGIRAPRHPSANPNR